MTMTPSVPPGERALHVFTNDYEWVIAADVADAKATYHEHNGGDPEDADEYEWERCDPAATMTIWCDADGNPDEVDGDGNDRVTKTFAEWAQRGRGYLATTEC